ncbi:MAG: hypothetical protein IPL01_19700 [Acidobacteria bacterium]|nr:hypothetical protein [Acidobacteriota bacterium]MBK9707232.1 hypothetical protein [Acidobacteriota bacterium]
MFPPIPAWDSIHPLVVHFPIALLMIAPILVVIGLLWQKQSRGLYIAALVLMVIGTIGAFVAVSSGQAGEGMAEKIAGAEAILHQHEELAETTRTIFAALTLIFAAILFAPRLFKRELGGKINALVMAAFLIFYLAGTVVLANTAHQGGRLVHEMGVRAAGFSGSPSATQPAAINQGAEAGKTVKDKDND